MYLLPNIGFVLLMSTRGWFVSVETFSDSILVQMFNDDIHVALLLNYLVHDRVFSIL
jgi:hypothetical protein